MVKNAFKALETLAKAASAAFDLDKFNRENPVLEGKEFDALQDKPRYAKPSKKPNADAQATKMKSMDKPHKTNLAMKNNLKEANRVRFACPVEGCKNTHPNGQEYCNHHIDHPEKQSKGISATLSPQEEGKLKRNEREHRRTLDVSKMGFADATVHLNSGKFSHKRINPTSIPEQKYNANTKHEFHDYFRREARNNKPMPLPKSFIIPSDAQLRKAYNGDSRWKEKTCWSCTEKPAATIHEGHPICNGCMDHFDKPQPAKDSEGRKFSQMENAKFSMRVEKGKAYSPGALAAWIGRKKEGKKKFQAMAAAGKHHKKKTNKPGGGKRFQKLEHELAAKKSVAKSDYSKYAPGQTCDHCDRPATMSLPKDFDGNRIKMCRGCHTRWKEENPHLAQRTPAEYIGENSARKSFTPGKLHKAGIDYITKHYTNKYCANCEDSITKSNADIHSVNFGERKGFGILCIECSERIRKGENPIKMCKVCKKRPAPRFGHRCWECREGQHTEAERATGVE